MSRNSLRNTSEDNVDMHIAEMVVPLVFLVIFVFLNRKRIAEFYADEAVALH